MGAKHGTHSHASATKGNTEQSIFGSIRGLAIALVIGVLLAAVVDLGFVNFHAIQSQFYGLADPTSITSTSKDSPDALVINKNSALEYTFGEGADVSNLSLGLNAEQQRKYGKYTKFNIYAIDEGSSVYYKLGSARMNFSPVVMTLHPSGNVKKIKISLDSYSVNTADIGMGQETKTPDYEPVVAFNTHEPIEPHWLMDVLIMLGVIAAYLLRPSSPIWRMSFESAHKPIIAMSVVFCLVAGAGIYVRYIPSSAEKANEMQYYELAQAFAQGHVYLDEQPSEELLALDNPYDTHARKAAGVQCPWDHAFYNGKYYVYFGALPCLVFFLPYYLATGGGALTVAIAVAISVALCVAGILRLSYAVVRRWFPRASLGMFLAITTTLLFGSWITYAAASPGHYALPIALGLALVCWGLAFWIQATGQQRIPLAQAVIGSALLALTIGCRPQMLASGLLVIALLILHARKYRDKRDWLVLAACTIPVLAIFAVQGWYNWERFGSVTDFGANYNLTSNDMTKRGFDVDRIPQAIVAYLIQPFAIGPDAPVLRDVDLDMSYFGVVITERLKGGILWLTPLCASVLFPLLPLLRRRFTREQIALVSISVVLAAVIAVFDANAAGVLFRYFMDFGIYVAFAAALCIGAVWCTRADRDDREPLFKHESIVSNDQGAWRYTMGGYVIVALMMATVVVMELLVLSSTAVLA